MRKGERQDDDNESTGNGPVILHGQNNSNHRQEIESMTFEISWFDLGFPGNFPTIERSICLGMFL